MNIAIEKGRSLTIGLEWMDCTPSTTKSVITDFVANQKIHGLTILTTAGQSSVGAIEDGGNYSAAAMLAQSRHNCLCVLSDNGNWWVASCVDSLPISDKVLTSKEEAISEAQALMSVMGDMDILGDASFFSEAFPETVIIPITWAGLLNLADKAALKKAKIVKFKSAVNVKQILLVAMLFPAIYWMYFSDSETEQDQAVPWAEIHQSEVNGIRQLYASTINNAPSQILSSYMQAILMYPYSVVGWTVSEVACGAQQCDMKWDHRDGAGSYADFRQAISIEEKKWGHTSTSQYSSDGNNIQHTVFVPAEPFNGDIEDIVLRDQFYLETLATVQNASKSKVFTWGMGSANMSGRLSPSPTGEPLPPIEFSYGQFTLSGEGLLNIARVANKLKTNQISINQLNITLKTLERPTWSIKGNYVYR